MVIPAWGVAGEVALPVLSWGPSGVLEPGLAGLGGRWAGGHGRVRAWPVSRCLSLKEGVTFQPGKPTVAASGNLSSGASVWSPV